jgi:hypothetical protein
MHAEASDRCSYPCSEQTTEPSSLLQTYHFASLSALPSSWRVKHAPTLCVALPGSPSGYGCRRLVATWCAVYRNSNMQEGKALLQAVLSLQPHSSQVPSRRAGAHHDGADPTVSTLSQIHQILAQLPEVLELEKASQVRPAPGGGVEGTVGTVSRYADQLNDEHCTISLHCGRQVLFMQVRNPFARLQNGAASPLGNALLQEVDRYQQLHNLLKSSLHELEMALLGQVVMSSTLEGMMVSLACNQVRTQGIQQLAVPLKLYLSKKAWKWLPINEVCPCAQAMSGPQRTGSRN